MERRLPIYLLIDTSAGMTGKLIYEVQNGIKKFVATLMKEPQAIETVWLSLITFNNYSEVLVPLTNITSFKLPKIQTGGGTSVGSALTILQNCILNDVRKGNIIKEEKGDLKPLIIMVAGSNPTDNWRPTLLCLDRKRIANFFVFCVTNNCNKSTFEEINGDSNFVFFSKQEYKKMENELLQFFRWKTFSLTHIDTNANKKYSISLPPPPDDGDWDDIF